MPAEWWRVGAAALPLIALLVGLLILRWPGVRAGLVALAATLLLAATVFAASTSVLSVALWRAPAPPPHLPYIVRAGPPPSHVPELTRARQRIGEAAAPPPPNHIFPVLFIRFVFR